MTPEEKETVKTIVNALSMALLLAAKVRGTSSLQAEETKELEGALTTATQAIKRFRPEETITPGPWRMEIGTGPDSGLYTVISDQKGDVVVWQMKGKANARLIALAPELLGALEALVSATSKIDDEYYATLVAAETTAQAVLARVNE